MKEKKRTTRSIGLCKTNVGCVSDIADGRGTNGSGSGRLLGNNGNSLEKDWRVESHMWDKRVGKETYRRQCNI